LTLVGGVALVLPGCSPADQGAFTLDETTGRPVLVVALCDGEHITGARLTVPGPEDDGSTVPPLWEVSATKPTEVDRIVAGTAPPDFVETVGPLTEVPPGTLIFDVEVDGGLAGGHGGFVEPAELEQGRLSRYGRSITLGELQRAARSNCEGDPVLVALGLAVLATGGFVLLAGTVVGVVAWRRHRRRSRFLAGRPPPPVPVTTSAPGGPLGRR